MTFSIFESSRKLGRPVELYLFQYGAGTASYFAYTNAEQIVTFGGIAYQPLPISRANFSVSGTLDKTDLPIDMPFDAGLPELIRLYPPSTVITLTIYQGHATDPDANFLTMWTGRVMACVRKSKNATVTCQSISTSLRRQGLRRNWQYGCPHVLYGPHCKASKVAKTKSATTASVNGYVVVLVDGWLAGDAASNYVGGTLEYTDVQGNAWTITIQQVNGVNNDTLTLVGPAQNLPGAFAVNVVAGCNHTLTGCSYHVNLPNYGGDPWIPTKNPVGLFNAFY